MPTSSRKRSRRCRRYPEPLLSRYAGTHSQEVMSRLPKGSCTTARTGYLPPTHNQPVPIAFTSNPPQPLSPSSPHTFQTTHQNARDASLSDPAYQSPTQPSASRPTPFRNSPTHPSASCPSPPHHSPTQPSASRAVSSDLPTIRPSASRAASSELPPTRPSASGSAQTQHLPTQPSSPRSDEENATDESNSSDEDDGNDDSHLFSCYIDKQVLELFEGVEGEVEEHEFGAEEEDSNIDQPEEFQLSTQLSKPNSQQQELSHQFNTFNSQTSAEVAKVVSSMKRSMRRPVFLGVISLYGKCRYTLEGYDHLVAMMRDGENGMDLPSVSTMRLFTFPRLLKFLFVTSSIESFPMKRGYTASESTSSKSRKVQTEAVVVRPTSWAALDVRCLHTLRELACVEKCRCARLFGSSDLRIDSATQVARREEVSRYPDTLWINKQGVPVPSTTGTLIRLHTSKASQHEAVSSSFSRTINGLNWKEVIYRGESCSAFDAEIVSTYHIRYETSGGLFFEEGLKETVLNDNHKFMYRSCVSYLRSLCRTSHTAVEASGRNDKGDESKLSEDQDEAADMGHNPRTRRQREKISYSNTRRVEDKKSFLIPGDHITIVSFGSGDAFGVFVSRFWVERLDDERNFFLFLYKDTCGRMTCTSIPTFGTPVYVAKRSRTPSVAPSEPTCQTTGVMANGLRFYRYRVILYADDFTPRSSLFPKGSTGGVYLTPCSFNLRSRRSQSSIRTVSLTPPGVSTNSVFEFLIDDLVTGSTEGFLCPDAFGQIVKVFIDVLGFIGDYPASSSVVDLKGHNATAPCTVCGFTFNKSLGTSVYAYTTSITCCNSAYRRSQERTSSIRAAGLTEFQEKCLGISAIESNNFLDSGSCPLLHFASKFNDGLEKNAENLPFTDYPKDGYTLNLIAPDHLLTGLFKGILSITFIQLPNNAARAQLELYLKWSLSLHGFQSQTQLYRCTKKTGSGLEHEYALLHTNISTSNFESA